ncbi:hypothetical protein GE061_004981 [Apolygus lucorum]|uniref:RING-type domain-containing protein n=1 Tax=Apolygus lucorum TaxID=248454 RepID=A0A8S9WWP4_APOLU|nr:hypothetical protein GE061_004981 [Apolygus lucorum]
MANMDSGSAPSGETLRRSSRSTRNDMSDGLFCNFHKCNTPLNGRVWVTRCLHVFCSEHGATHFHNNRIQVQCPVCNEVNVRENDVLLCDTNPNDMILAGLRPEKILRLLEKSFKMWKCQIDAERNHDSSKIHLLSTQIEEQTNNFKRSFREKEIEYSSHLAALQADYNDVMVKLKQVNQELETTKSSLRKYKVAYESLINTREPPVRRRSSHHMDLSSQVIPSSSLDEESLFRVTLRSLHDI